METEISGNLSNRVGGREAEVAIVIKNEENEEIACGEDGNLGPKPVEMNGALGREGRAEEAEAVNSQCVVDVGEHGGELLRCESFKGEKVCRICHLSSEEPSGGSDLIQLGCDCKDELGVSHRHCAETWFKQKKNRQCEICGKTARNIVGIEDTALVMTPAPNRPRIVYDRGFMMEPDSMRMIAATSSSNYSDREVSCLRRNSCNLLLACLVLAFVIPWFFRIDVL